MVPHNRFANSLPGGARIACKEAPSSIEGASASTRPQENGRLPGRTDDVGQLSSLSSRRSCSKVLLNDRVGFTGLNNLGNTCFMNCVLQALANNKYLRDYFLTKNFLDDVNEENPLGTKGKLARSFHIVLKNLWSGEEMSYAPTKLKSIIANIAPQFMGFMQHDAQEFMAFFLDALHEDLNRVQLKPVFEVPQLGDQEEHLIANKSWNLHKSRNDSFIVDKFHGMYKSKLTCPICSKESTTFDPFLFLPVPIPKPQRLITVTFFGRSIGPTKLGLCVPEEGAGACDILSHISVKYSLPMTRLHLFQTELGNVKKEFSSSSLLPPLSTSPSLVVCELADNTSNHAFVLQRVRVQSPTETCLQCGKGSTVPGVNILRCSKCKTAGYCSQDCQKSHWSKHKLKCRQRFVGCPFLVSLDLTTNYAKLSQRLHKLASYSVDIFHCTRESLRNFESEVPAGGPLTSDSYNVFACYGGDTQITFPWKNDLDLRKVSHLILEWLPNVTASETNIGKHNVRSHKPSIQDCIKLFTEPEVLAAEEAWYCPNCKKHTEATKEISLWQLPDILIIQLKRFSFQSRMWRDKIDRLVQFPVSGLDMSPFCVSSQADPPVYDLFAVVNHHGGLFGGHYTSYVRLSEEFDDGAYPGWRLCDDSHVTSVRNEDQLVTTAAYVLFYQRRRKNNAFLGSGGDDGWASAIDSKSSKLPQESDYLLTEQVPSPLDEDFSLPVISRSHEDVVNLENLPSVDIHCSIKDVVLQQSKDILSASARASPNFSSKVNINGGAGSILQPGVNLEKPPSVDIHCSVNDVVLLQQSADILSASPNFSSTADINGGAGSILQPGVNLEKPTSVDIHCSVNDVVLLQQSADILSASPNFSSTAIINGGSGSRLQSGVNLEKPLSVDILCSVKDVVLLQQSADILSTSPNFSSTADINGGSGSRLQPGVTMNTAGSSMKDPLTYTDMDDLD